MKIKYQINILYFASKKGVSSSKNGRDSQSKRLGIKVGDGQFAKSGNIIFRQRGTQIFAGQNVKIGKDHTLFATAPGIVKFFNINKNKKAVKVVPVKE